MFWFKNLIVYRLSHEVSLNADEMEKQLSAFAFTPCGSQDMAKTGWVSLSGLHSDTLTHALNGQILLCARKEEKILPSPVIKQVLQAKIERLEGEQQRKLKKTERDALKHAVLQRLLPRAFSRFSQTFMWIDTVNNLVMVDAASAKRAEDILALLRKSLGSLRVAPLIWEKPIELTLTEWVHSGNLPVGLIIQDEADLKATLEEGGLIRCKKQNLMSDEIAAHIEAGKRVTKLALSWKERIQLVLSDDGSLKRLKFFDTLREKNDHIDGDDMVQRFNADFILMTSKLTVLVKSIREALGSEAQR